MRREFAFFGSQAVVKSGRAFNTTAPPHLTHDLRNGGFIVQVYWDVGRSLAGSLPHDGRSKLINILGFLASASAFGHVEDLSKCMRSSGAPVKTNKIQIKFKDFQTTPLPEILLSGSDAAAVRRIPVKGLIDNADPELNVRLHGGEEIRVPEAGRVYVLGNVKKSGAFAIAESSETTVLKAIALSEGLLPYTAKEAFIYRAAVGKRGRDEITVRLSEG